MLYRCGCRGLVVRSLGVVGFGYWVLMVLDGWVLDKFLVDRRIFWVRREVGD